MKSVLAAGTLSLLLISCGGGNEPDNGSRRSASSEETAAETEAPTPAPVDPAPEAASAKKESKEMDSEAAVEHLREAVTALAAKPEHKASSVRVQHLLVAFKGAPRMSGIERSKEEAEVLTAELLVRIENEEDFDALVKEYTNDSHPGIYSMDTGSRKQMVGAFGNVAWRLEVGEVGVAPWDTTQSPFGWHIIKRLE